MISLNDITQWYHSVITKSSAKSRYPTKTVRKPWGATAWARRQGSLCRVPPPQSETAIIESYHWKLSLKSSVELHCHCNPKSVRKPWGATAQARKKKGSLSHKFGDSKASAQRCHKWRLSLGKVIIECYHWMLSLKSSVESLCHCNPKWMLSLKSSVESLCHCNPKSVCKPRGATEACSPKSEAIAFQFENDLDAI